MSEFVPFPKLSRLSREMVVTEKLDGTNAQIKITALSPEDAERVANETGEMLVDHLGTTYLVQAGSRNRWLSIHQDNFGFANWVNANLSAVVWLGEGTHFGEWWGKGIQRGYGLDEKRFSLFNVSRWESAVLPSILSVVPTLYRGMFDTARVDYWLEVLANTGSVAAPGFMQPEGVVVFHTHSGQLFKKTLDKNDEHKGAA